MDDDEDNDNGDIQILYATIPVSKGLHWTVLSLMG